MAGPISLFSEDDEVTNPSLHIIAEIKPNVDRLAIYKFIVPISEGLPRLNPVISFPKRALFFSVRNLDLG